MEPFLYVSSHKEESFKRSLNLKRVKRGESCRGTYVSGHLLRAFFSVPHKNKHESNCNANSFSALDSELLPFICEELQLCLQAFSELLAEASFNWDNVLVCFCRFFYECLVLILLCLCVGVLGWVQFHKKWVNMHTPHACVFACKSVHMCVQFCMH